MYALKDECWDHDLIENCFSRVLGEPFEWERLEGDDQWIKYKVMAGRHIVNSNLVIDYGDDVGGEWAATPLCEARYVGIRFACQLWLDYPVAAEVAAHLEAGLPALAERMAAEDGGEMTDTIEDGRRKIFFEREWLLPLGIGPDVAKPELVRMAKAAMGDVTIASEAVIYPE